MEYWVLIDANTPAGAVLLSLLGKIGGATTTVVINNITHPMLIATDLDWSSSPAFVRMTHHRNPGAEDPLKFELVLPNACVLLATPRDEAVQQQQANPPKSSLH